MGLCRVGNYGRKVSCRDEQQWCHVEWETMGEQFPAGVKHSSAKSDRKLYAKGFLLR